MIQANELRIGNYVKALGEYRMVIGITSGKFPSSYVKFEGLIPLKIIHLKPVELTEEWLIKLGFQSEEAFCYELDDILINTSRELIWIHTKCKNNVELGMPYYLHELQNLYFALTKNELIVNSDKENEL
jgi:hypothetical protein